MKMAWLIRDLLVLMFAMCLASSQQENNCLNSSKECLSDLKSVSSSKCLVFGPGLRPGTTLPARYFFIQAVNGYGENFTVSPSKGFEVRISEINEERSSVWSQVFNKHDGSFIVRYRLFKQLQGIEINITFNGSHVGSSPYLLRGPQYPESCFCQENMESWLKRWECPSSHPQIEEDLLYFPKIDIGSSLKDATNRFNVPGAYSFCHYQIINSQLYKKCYGQYVGFSMFMDEIILSLLRKVSLSDTEFLVNLGDWPLEHKAPTEDPIPFLSWCGSKTTRDIVIPTYDLTESSLEMMGRVTLDVLSVQGSTTSPRWSWKQEIAFWRGRDSRLERLELVGLAKKHPELINASLTNFFFFQDKEEEYGPKEDHISFFDFFKYKYQINIDGTVAAYRFPYLLAGDSLVLKQNSDYYEFFYSLLEPMVHYVPFKSDLSDLLDRIQWAKDHDSEAKGIAENAREFVNQNLMPQNIYCYYALLLNKYTQYLVNPVVKLPDMEIVPQPVDKASCQCLKQKLENPLKDEL